MKWLFSELVLPCIACICRCPEARRGAWRCKFYFLSVFFGNENKQVCVASRASTWSQCRELQHHFLSVATVGVEMQSLRLLSEALTCWKTYKQLSSELLLSLSDFFWSSYLLHLLGCVWVLICWMEIVLQWAQFLPGSSMEGASPCMSALSSASKPCGGSLLALGGLNKGLNSLTPTSYQPCLCFSLSTA